MTEDNQGLEPGAEDLGADSVESAPGAPVEPTPSEPAGSASAVPASPDTAAADSASAGAGVGTGDVDMTAFEAEVGDSDLANALSRIAELEDQVARAHADLYNLNQEYSNYVRRAKDAAPGHRDAGQSEVIEALIGVLDDIDAARAHGDLADGPFAAIATKLESTLESRFSLERYGAEGEDFDPALHEALLANANPEVDRPLVAKVLQPGYRRGERILRAAKVMVDNPA